jgi:hypothetical protein
MRNHPMNNGSSYPIEVIFVLILGDVTDRYDVAP